MGLFNFLFSKEEKKKKSVFDFFQINIKKFPDESFIDLGVIYDKDGVGSRIYTKTFDYLECGIFSDIEVSIYHSGFTVEFSSKPSTSLNINKFCELANSLYRIYGKDDQNDGIITSQEISDYRNYGALARFWYLSNYPMIGITAFDVDDNIIRLKIMGISLEELIEEDTNDENPKETIFDFFRTDIRELPDDRFDDEGVIYNNSGDKIRVFSTTLDYLECGIFNEIEVYQFDNNIKNIFFKSKKYSEVRINKIANLTNEIFHIYGNDMNEQGIYTEKDKIDCCDIEYVSFRRMWRKDDFHICIDVDRGENEITLSLLGITQDSK